PAHAEGALRSGQRLPRQLQHRPATGRHEQSAPGDRSFTMTDYGHDLIFGTFITPRAQPPMHAVDLAVAADRAGLDLVTLQDHPYQPAFHDTWTLLSYVASRTERVRVTGNVLNLPLRQP